MLNSIADLLLPPASLALLAFVCLLAGGRWRRPGLAALALLLVLGMPATPILLMAALAAPASPALGPAPEAIVILSAEAVRAPEGLDLNPGLLSLDRLRAGAALHRRTDLPILVSGGSFAGSVTSLGAMMARSLEQDFRVDVRWQETKSRDTWENAEFSTAILRQAGISRAYLVTQSWHMRRALLAFSRFGLDVTPAPAHPDVPPRLTVGDFIPRASAWQDSFYAMHEWVGWAYYKLRS